METATAVQSLPVEQLKPNPWNRKIFDPDAMEDLVHSIKTCGVQEPLIVRSVSEGSYELASGNRRWLAAKEAGLKEVPCLVQTITDQQMTEDSVTLNIQREDIAPLELAQMLADYGSKQGKSQREMAGIFGKTEAWVSQYIAYAGLHPDLKNLTAVKFSTGDLRALKPLKPESQQQIAQELKDGKLKPEDVQKRCKELAAGGAHAASVKAPPAPPQVFDKGGQKFTFTRKGKNFTITTDTSNLEYLDAFMQNIRCAFIDYTAAEEQKAKNAAKA